MKIYISIIFKVMTCIAYSLHVSAQTLEQDNTRDLRFIEKNQAYIQRIMKRPTTANFEFIYDGTQTPSQELMTLMNFAGDILSREFISPIPIKVQITVVAPNNSFGAAGSYFPVVFSGAPFPNQSYPKALANLLAGHNLNNFSDMRITIPVNDNNYLGIDGFPASDQNDLLTIVLHELYHGMGFSMDRTTGSVRRFATRPNRFFSQTIASSKTRFIDFPTGSDEVINLLSSLRASFFLNQPDKPVLSGGTFAGLSHLNEAAYPAGDDNAMMTPVFQTGEVTRDMGPFVRQLFRDLGYPMADDFIDQAVITVPQTINITIAQGETQATTRLYLLNNITNNQNVTITPKTENINIQENTAQRLTNSPVKLNLTVNAENLRTAFAQTNLVITSENGQTHSVPVHIYNQNVAAQKVLSVTIENMDAEVVSNTFTVQTVTFKNEGDVIVEFIPAVDKANNQIQLQRISLLPGESQSVNVTVNAANAAPGNTINTTLTAAEINTGEIITSTTFSVDVVAPLLDFSENTLNFSVNLNEPSTLLTSEQTITITNEGSSVRAFNLIVPQLLDASVRELVLEPSQSEIITLTLKEDLITANALFDDAIILTDLISTVDIATLPITFEIQGITPELELNFNFAEEIINNTVDLGFLSINDSILGDLSSCDQCGLIPRISNVIPSNETIVPMLFQEPFASFIPFEIFPIASGPFSETLTILLEDDPSNPIVITVTANILDKTATESRNLRVFPADIDIALKNENRTTSQEEISVFNTSSERQLLDITVIQNTTSSNIELRYPRQIHVPAKTLRTFDLRALVRLRDENENTSNEITNGVVVIENNLNRVEIPFNIAF